MRVYARPVALLIVALVYVALNQWGAHWADELLGGGLALGLLAIGIPHGALDVWTHGERKPGRAVPYVITYLLSIAGVLAGWWQFPHAGLLAFLASLSAVFRSVRHSRRSPCVFLATSSFDPGHACAC